MNGSINSYIINIIIVASNGDFLAVIKVKNKFGVGF
jgi:hypothetical protein